MNCSFHQIIFGWANKGGWNAALVGHKGNAFRVSCKNVKGRDHWTLKLSSSHFGGNFFRHNAGGGMLLTNVDSDVDIWNLHGSCA